MADPPSIATQTATADPGGPATLRPPGPLGIPPATPDPSRAITPDATGFYEADPIAPMWNSNRLLQLNQAGHALVGWFVPPPLFVQPLQSYPVAVAVLVADLTATVKDGVQFFYRTFDSIDGVDPDSVLSPFYPFDPSEWQDGTNAGTIQIQIASDQDGWEFLTPKVAVTLTFMLDDGTQSPPLSFIHKNPAARVAERTIAFQPANLQRALIARHRWPIPSTFFDTSKDCGAVWRNARALFDPDPNGALATQIRLYMVDADSSGPGGYTNRAIALDKMRTLLSFAWDATHEKFLAMLLTRDATQNSLTIGTTTTSYREWLSRIAVNEVAMRANAGVTATNSPDLLAYPAEFGSVMAGAKVYRYNLAFSAIKADGAIVPFVKGAAGVFQVKVTASASDLPSDGKIPSDEQFESVGYPAPFYGAFFEMMGGTGGPPSLPESVNVYSGTQIAAADFAGAFFEVYALKASIAPTVGLTNPLMSLGASVSSGGDTQLIRLHVMHMVLEGTFAQGNVVPKLVFSHSFKKPDWNALSKIFSGHGIAEDSDFCSITKGAGVTLGACAGLGYIGVQQGFSDWMRPPSSVGSGWQEGGDARTVDACFERDSADFTQRKVNGWEVRFLLETILAADLALFNGVPNVDVEGFASPEYTPQHNLILSKKRAAAILQAILDAVGSLDPDSTTADGKGDEGALAAGLHESDPTGDPQDRADFTQQHQEEVAKWPQWRKVTINIRGRFYVHVITVNEDEG